jgi:hypothetical protein
VGNLESLHPKKGIKKIEEEKKREGQMDTKLQIKSKDKKNIKNTRDTKLQRKSKDRKI